MTDKEKALLLLNDPIALGRVLGYEDFRKGLHDVWIRRMISPGEDMTLQAHRGSYKTTCLCIAIALMMIRYRDKNIIFLRKTDADVVEVVKNVQRILVDETFCAMYKALTGASLGIIKATGAEITTTAYCAPRGASQLLGIGTSGSLTGKHADIIITDDIINLKDRLSAAERMRTRSVYQELQNIRNPGGRIINTGTPWHKEDAFALMPPPERFDCYSTGLLSPEKLEALKRSMEPSLFAANYELRHIASDDALFDIEPGTTDNANLLRDGIAHIDASYGGEDFTAFTCAARRGDTIYLYGRLWHAHVDTVMDAILTDCDRLMCAPIYCETNADKSYLARELRRRGAQTRAYAEKQNKYFKISTYLRKWWGHVVFLSGTDRAYIEQILDYTEQAAHDDAPDSAACVCRILDRRE